MNKYPKIQVRTILPDFKTGSFLYAGVYCIFLKKKPLCREKASLSMFHLLFLSKYSSEGSKFDKKEVLKEEGSSSCHDF